MSLMNLDRVLIKYHQCDFSKRGQFIILGNIWNHHVLSLMTKTTSMLHLFLSKYKSLKQKH